MKKIILGGACIAASILSASAQTQSIAGFTEQSGTQQKQTEASFNKGLSAENIGATIKHFSDRPHNIGSPAGKLYAEQIAARLKEYGFETNIETYQVLFPTPKTRLLEMTSPTVYKAILKEPALKEDATSGQDGQLPTYNAWSADGDVSGDLVFVNYGLPADYDELARLGVDVRGKIVIAKYGQSWRGIKPKVAQEHGAIGCIIYSDPKDDGYFRGDVYPKGAFKNEYGVQRGSVMDMVVYPGDPLTPGIGSTKDAQRIASHTEAVNLLKIPVLPISYKDAQPLLAALEGPVAPAAWRGALPFTYHIGPGKTKVHLKLEFNWNTVPCYDVVGKIKGDQYPDQWVVRGNHHDAWVNGAADPCSGLASMLEEAKSIGALLKTGWKPKRTLVYCAWDGEEPGLLGSTEWLEDHQQELQQKCVVYINTDNNGRGFLDAAGSHALSPLMDGVAKDVIDPQTKVSLFERANARQVIHASSPKAKKDALNKKELDLGALGSGSDYSSFLQHAGIPSLNLGFGGEDEGGEYHSIYDSYDDYTRFKDPGFAYGLALSQTAGLAVLRMANADVLPFNFVSLYKTINGYVTELQSMVDDMRDATATENEVIKKKLYQLASDPKEVFNPAAAKEPVPYIDFSGLKNALDNLQKAADSASSSSKKMLTAGTSASAFNNKLYQAEQSLLLPDGLPRRSWFKHSIYAPGYYTGYGVKTMPGIREAIEQRSFKEAQEQINAAAGAVNRLAEYLGKL